MSRILWWLVTSTVALCSAEGASSGMAVVPNRDVEIAKAKFHQKKQQQEKVRQKSKKKRTDQKNHSHQAAKVKSKEHKDHDGKPKAKATPELKRFLKAMESEQRKRAWHKELGDVHGRRKARHVEFHAEKMETLENQDEQVK